MRDWRLARFAFHPGLPDRQSGRQARASIAPIVHCRLSLSKTKSEHSGGAIHRELAVAECVLLLERLSERARPCPEIDVRERHCNIACTKAANDADAARRIR
jgi:hypothetical protein